ncbi:MAG TPA: hypothetical protein VFD25_05135 [Clostridia bacterium]|nr:hypothetical protein [Clostridia bacterium]
MVAEMLQKVLDAEQKAQEIIDGANSQAESILHAAKEQAENIKSEMADKAKAELSVIDESITRRADFAQLDAKKRADSEIERLKTVTDKKRSEVIGKLIKEAVKG